MWQVTQSQGQKSRWVQSEIRTAIGKRHDYPGRLMDQALFPGSELVVACCLGDCDITVSLVKIFRGYPIFGTAPSQY
jgi:hypothetical protein